MNEITWQSPSNIALVKYWGKLENQIPANPSISFTLNACKTITTLKWKKKEDHSHFDFIVFLDGKVEPSFKPKIEAFFNRVDHLLPFLKEFSFEIHTKNTFPHSSGIASSASGMSALSLCLASMAQHLNIPHDSNFDRFASTLSRLGSGSASRSVYGNLVIWGYQDDIKGSSNKYSIPYPDEVHPIFQNFQDFILLVDKGEKQVSSTTGHGLMKNHPFAKRRFAQAHENLTLLKGILKSGDLKAFGELIESEALTLHSMMMTSIPYYLLFKPNTIAIIQEIWNFRKETDTPVFFTLDAGANVHMLFPENVKELVNNFVEERIVAYCKNQEYICDEVGGGPIQI